MSSSSSSDVAAAISAAPMNIELTARSAAYLAFRLLPFLIATVLALAPLMVFSWKGLPYLFALLVTLAASKVVGGLLGVGLDYVTAKPIAWVAAQMPQMSSSRGWSAQDMQRTCAAFSLGGGNGVAGMPAAAPLDVVTLAFSTAYLMFFIGRNDLGGAYRGVQVIMPLLLAGYCSFMAFNGCMTAGRGVAALAVGGLGGWLTGKLVTARFPGLAYLKAPPASGVTCVRTADGILTCHGGDPNNSPDDE
jgi:hypothetical protein